MKQKEDKALLFASCKMIIAAAVFAVLMLAVAAAEPASAAVSELDRGVGMIPEKTKLSLSKSNAVVATSAAVEKKTKSGLDIYCVRIPTTASPYTFDNLMTITYENAAVIGGEAADVILSVDRLAVSRSADASKPDSSAGYVGFMWLSSSGTSFGRPYEGVYGYKAEKKITASVKVVKHGTSTAMTLPCFMAVRDIDLPVSEKVTYYREAWKGISGFSGKYYVYRGNRLNITDKASDYPTFSSDNYSDTAGADSTYKTGLYALTSGSSFKFMFYEGNCGTNLGIYSQYKTDKPPLLEKPVKRVGADLLSNTVKEGGTVKYTIKQKIGVYYNDVLSPYEKLVFTDRLPDGLTYESAALYSGQGKNITSQGSLSYSRETHTLKFSMGRAWLDSIKNYDGQTLKLVINTRAAQISEPVKNVKNTASVSFADGAELMSNSVATRIYKTYSASYVYKSGTDGKNLPGEISTESGAFAVSDSGRYTQGDTVRRKPQPDNGSTHITNEGTWSLRWEQDVRTIDRENITFTGVWTFTEKDVFRVRYRYVSGSDGRALPENISTSQGEYRISDEQIYSSGSEATRKASPADGSVCRAVNSRGVYTGSWKLSWDSEKKLITDSDVTFVGTWTYTPAPKIEIIKKIPDSFDETFTAHGEPVFIFEIKDGSRIWYRAICFSEEAVENIKKYGEYRLECDGTKYFKEDGYLCGTCSAVLPEGEYTVTEIKTGRYEADCAVRKAVLSADNEQGVNTEAVCEFVNRKTVYGAFSHSDYIRNTLAGGNEIGAGESYITSGGSVLSEGDYFPRITETGDIYKCGDYEYQYNRRFEGSGWSTDESIGGWGVRAADDTKTTYGHIAESINGEPVSCLANTFAYCENMTRAPEIGENITELAYAFAGCASLGGKVSINASPDSTDGCFAGTYSTILITGRHDEDICAALCATSERGNVSCGIIRENATYYDSSEDISLKAGDEYPDLSGSGDVYMDEDYEYRYGMNYNGASWSQNDIDGWCVRVTDDSREEYGMLESRICFAEVKGLIRTFSGCEKLIKAPEIPEYITDMSYAFSGCEKLSGDIVYVE